MAWEYIVQEATAYSKVETWHKNKYVIVRVSDMNGRTVDIMIGGRIARSPTGSDYNVEEIQRILDNSDVQELRKLFIIEAAVKDGEDSQ